MKIYLIPYLRQFSHRDMLYRVWRLIEQHGDWGNIYWHDRDRDNQFGDLVYFIQNMHDPDDPKHILIAVDDDGNICGLVWFNRLEGDECEGNLWMARGWRPLARQVVRNATEAAFKLGYNVVHGTTPHTSVRNLLIKCGYEDLGQIEGKVWCLRMESENGKRRRENKSPNYSS